VRLKSLAGGVDLGGVSPASHAHAPRRCRLRWGGRGKGEDGLENWVGRGSLPCHLARLALRPPFPPSPAAPHSDHVPPAGSTRAGCDGGSGGGGRASRPAIKNDDAAPTGVGRREPARRPHTASPPRPHTPKAAATPPRTHASSGASRPLAPAPHPPSLTLPPFPYAQKLTPASRACAINAAAFSTSTPAAPVASFLPNVAHDPNDRTDTFRPVRPRRRYSIEGGGGAEAMAKACVCACV
jgi:hypothetical protein